MRTVIYLEATSTGWTGGRSLSELGIQSYVCVDRISSGGSLFTIKDGERAVISRVPGSMTGEVTSWGASKARVLELAATSCRVESIVPVGAACWEADAGRAGWQLYSAVNHGPDLVFSRIDDVPPDISPRAQWPGTAATHAFVEADIDERTPSDLSLVEREVKLDASEDPRPAGWNLEFEDGSAIFSGLAAPDVHFHRVHGVGPSGLIEMTTDPDAGPQLLKYKYEVADDLGSIAYRRLEVVEPATWSNFERIVRDLDPGADPENVSVTPYFRRDRVKTNVYVAESRSVFEVFADHSEFLVGGYAPFDQVEIEYIGVIGPSDAKVEWGLGNPAHLEDEFAAIEALVIRGYGGFGIELTRSRRRKYDWAVTEVLGPSEE